MTDLSAGHRPYVEVHETHTGIVVLAGDRAFKAKKPILTDFLDFRTPEQRERACRREVELNRRLSPESYLGVAHLSDPTGGQAEPIVVMRRYRDDERLSSLVACGQPGNHSESARGVLDTIAEVLADFYRRAERNAIINAEGSPDGLDQRWRDNLSELYCDTGAGISEESVRRIEHLAAQYISGRAPLFARRIEQGRIVDGHGDLLADDIFWVDGQLAILDCLEFDDKLRYVDCVDDAAFLAMDLEFLGRSEAGEYFLERFVAQSADTAPSSLWHFYIAYRAVVRAKVDCLRHAQGKLAAAADAARHLNIAQEHLETGAVRLALVGGNPGTGKSTLAHALAEQVDAQVISTDDVRRELQTSGVIAGEPGLLDAGLYAPANTATVYQTVLHRARACLGDGHSVVLDGTWLAERFRAQAKCLAAETGSTLVELLCVTTDDVAAGRIETRRTGNSDATPDIATRLAARGGGWNTAHRIDTSRELRSCVHRAHDIWRAAVADPTT